MSNINDPKIFVEIINLIRIVKKKINLESIEHNLNCLKREELDKEDLQLLKFLRSNS